MAKLSQGSTVPNGKVTKILDDRKGNEKVGIFISISFLLSVYIKYQNINTSKHFSKLTNNIFYTLYNCTWNIFSGNLGTKSSFITYIFQLSDEDYVRHLSIFCTSFIG